MTNVSCDTLSVFNKKNELILYKNETIPSADYVIKNATITYYNNIIIIIGKEIKYHGLVHILKDYHEPFQSFDESEHVELTSKLSRFLNCGAKKIIRPGVRKLKSEPPIQISFTKLNRDVTHIGF